MASRIDRMLCLKCNRLLILVLLFLFAKHTTLAQGNVYTGSKKGVYVCITGQLSRVELGNKIKKLLKPLNRLGYHTYIGLALTTDSPHFTNINNGDKMRLLTSIGQATHRLLNTAGVKEVRHFMPQHSEDMYANMWYKQHLDNDNSISRVKNHARQYHTLQYCNEWSNISQFTDLTIRVRDDILFERINVPEIVQHTLQTGAVVTSTCDAWAGMNDKVAFLPSTKSKDFFHLPYEKYHTFHAEIPALNPEKYYHHVYSSVRFPMSSVSSLYVAKAITQILPEPEDKLLNNWRQTFNFKGGRNNNNNFKTNNYSLCQVISNVHKSFSPGCDAAFAADAGTPTASIQNPSTFLSSPSFGVTYKTKCWK